MDPRESLASGVAPAPETDTVPLTNKVDLREQLFNSGAVGLITEVSFPEANVTQLNAIMTDIDPKMFNDQIADEATKADPQRFYEYVVRPMLERHPVLAKAQVRASGSGLHVLLHMNPPVVFRSESERSMWSSIVKVIQRILPSDPNAPGITILTRPLGSINSKTGRVVKLLAPGEPVAPDEVMALFNTVREAPVGTIQRIMLGDERISPCPICQKEGSSLSAMDRGARCYGCGKVSLSQVYDVFLQPPCPPRKGK